MFDLEQIMPDRRLLQEMTSSLLFERGLVMFPRGLRKLAQKASSQNFRFVTIKHLVPQTPLTSPR